MTKFVSPDIGESEVFIATFKSRSKYNSGLTNLQTPFYAAPLPGRGAFFFGNHTEK